MTIRYYFYFLHENKCSSYIYSEEKLITSTFIAERKAQ